MAIDFESFIADPKITDPGIDVSGIKTTTPTRQELLFDLPEFSGIQVDPTRASYVEDIYRAYSGQIPSIPEPVVTTPPVTSGVGTGDGGQATTPITTPTTTVGTNTAEQQRLIDAGIGVQAAPGQPVVAPGEVPVTQAEIDAFNQIPVNTDFRNQQLVNQGIGVRVGDTGPVVAPGEEPVTQAKMDEFNEEQQSTLQNILGQAGQTVQGAMNQLGKISGSVVDFANQTVDIFGKKINVGKTLAAAAINKIAGGPVSLVFELLPKDSIENKTTRGVVDTLKAEKDYGFNMQSGNLNQDPFGRNPVSAFGNYEQTLLDDIAGVNQSGFETAKMREKKKEFAQDYFKKKAEFAGGVQQTSDQISDILGPGEFKPEGENLVSLENQLAEQAKERAAQNELAKLTGDVDFDVPTKSQPVTGTKGPPSVISGPQVTAPGTVLGKPGIERFDDAETDIGGKIPAGASTTGTPVDALNPVNRQQHFDNTQKLKDAVTDGKITNEEYNKLSAFDARKTMGLGTVTGTASAAIYQGVQTGIGALRETLGINPAFAGDQSLAEAAGDTARNIQGVSGNITPEEQVKYQEIISGEDIYRDPILGMVEPSAPMTLADDKINTMTDDVDLDLFDTTPSAPSIPTTGIDIPDPSPTPSFTPRGGGADRDPAPSPSPSPNEAAGRAAENAQRAAIQEAARAGMTVNQAKASVGMPANLGDTGGGDKGGGGGKIVCTMMNESYGFGSFRNKIWMKFHKNLSPEYQRGYHKLFLPLVKIAKTNKIVKKILEHIAVHSTIDMRQSMRGKTHLLGRAYRKILLPLCYWVGKNA